MKILCRSSVEYIDEVNGVKIYWDKTSGKTYIYTEPNGRGMMEFPNRGEAEKWILDNDPSSGVFSSSGSWIKSDITGDKYRLVYGINGFECGKSYFMSFGIKERDLDDMYRGKTITKGDNEFSIEAENEYGNTFVVDDVLDCV